MNLKRYFESNVRIINFELHFFIGHIGHRSNLKYTEAMLGKLEGVGGGEGGVRRGVLTPSLANVAL